MNPSGSESGYRDLRDRERQWEHRGAPVKLLDAKEAAAKIGSDAYCGALLDRRAETLQPLAYARGLARAAAEAGARLHTGSPVTALDRSGKGWRLTTPPLQKAVRESILPGREGAWDTNLVLSSYRMDRDGRLVVGSVGSVENLGFRLNKQWAARTLRKVFPRIGPVPLEHAWYGKIAMTADHIPRFHLPDRDMVMITSFNGRGIGPGTVFGKLLAEYIRNGDPNEIPLPVTEPEPVFMRNLRGAFYETGARIYHLVQRRLP